jgi:NADPH2:quinone reductase
MKAIRAHTHGGPEVLTDEEVPQPVPGPLDALVKIDAAGVNFIDVYHRAGRYPLPLPYTIGQEGAGTVVALGTEARGVRIGDRVAYTGVLGGYAEYAAVPADRLVRLPEGVSSKHGAATMLQGMTAHYLACTTYPLKPGDTCLVHAAAGGVGLLLCQVAKLRGARVIGTVSTDERSGSCAPRAGRGDSLHRIRFRDRGEAADGGAGVRLCTMPSEGRPS